MVDSRAKPPVSMNGSKWENFDDDAHNSAEISVGRTDYNNLPPEKFELITGDAAFKQQGESSPKVNGLKGTPSSWEKLGDISGDFPLSTSKAKSPQFDIRSGSRGVQNLHRGDQVTNIGLEIPHETTLESKEKENPEEKFVQSSELPEGEADGGGTKLNGSSHIPRSLESEDHTTNNLNWTTFEEGRGKESPTEEANERKGGEFRSLSTENRTPANSKMAAFDSSAARAAEIMPNLISIPESGDAKMNPLPKKQESNNADTIILTEKISTNSSSEANNAKSAVSSVNINSVHKDLKGEGQTICLEHDVQRGRNWVCFGEDGKVISTLQPGGQEVLSASSNNTSSVDLKASKVTLVQPPTRDLAVNCKTETAEDIGLHPDEQAKTREGDEKNTSFTLTAAELDVLAQNTWMQFDNSVKDQKQGTPNADKTSATKSSCTSWVTFGESSVTANQPLSLCGLDGGGKNELSSSPSSPNPFIPPHEANPFKPTPLGVVTNPFKAEGGISSEVRPYPAMSSQKSGSTPSAPLEASASLISERNLAGSQPVTPSKPKTSPKGLSDDGNVLMPEIASDQVDNKAVILLDEQKHVVLEAEEDGPLIDEKAASTPNGSWSMLLRFPDKKRKIGSRDWKSVVIRLEGTTLQIYEEYELSAPFREIPLQAYFAFTAPKLQSFERGAKVHTVKLEYIKYTESRRLRHRGTIEHIAEGTSIIKIASPSHVIVQELLESVNNSIRLLPAYRDRGITYRRDEVFVDVDDVSNVLLSGDGMVLRKNSKVLVKLKAFLTGDPECQLVLNDVCVREREEARLRGELKPQRVHHWVKLRHCDFHKCVNVANFEQSHAITFHPLDACTFELMRFRVEHHKPLPLLVKTSLNVHNEQRVELKAEVQVCQETKMARYVRNNVVFRFPIPESWVPLFRTGKKLRGEKSIQSSRGRRAAGIKSRLKHSKCAITVTLGKAMYEPEYGSVVWRIDQLPLIHSKVPVDAPQMLTCSLDLPPGMDYPENYKPTAELEYDVAYVLVSDTNVIAVKVSNQNIPDKWVCYRAFYHYDIDIDISKPVSGPVRDVGCLQQ